MRRLMYISHMALGFSGALCFLVLTGILLYKMPVVNSLLAHADQAANNAVTTTGVIASASAEQAKQAAAIERDVRVMTWHADRTMGAADRLLGSSTRLVNTASGQIAHLGPLLDSLKKSSDALPDAIDHITETADASTVAIRSVTGVALDVHGRISDKRIDDLIDYLHGTAQHVDRIAASGDTIMENGAKVSTKLTNDFLKPVPWWKWPIQKANDLIDIGGAVARHAP